MNDLRFQLTDPSSFLNNRQLFSSKKPKQNPGSRPQSSPAVARRHCWLFHFLSRGMSRATPTLLEIRTLAPRAQVKERSASTGALDHFHSCGGHCGSMRRLQTCTMTVYTEAKTNRKMTRDSFKMHLPWANTTCSVSRFKFCKLVMVRVCTLFTVVC